MILGIVAGIVEATLVTGGWMYYHVLMPEGQTDNKAGNVDGRKAVAAVVCLALSAVFMNVLMWGKQYRTVTYGNLIQIFVILAIAAGVDYKKHLIPNKLLLTGMACRLALLLFEGIFYPEEAGSSLFISVLGMAMCLAFMLFLSFLTKRGIGLGDVKLFAWLGFSVGVMEAYYILFYSVLAAAVAALFLLCVKKTDRKGKLPFAPFVFIGCYLVFVMSFF